MSTVGRTVGRSFANTSDGSRVLFKSLMSAGSAARASGPRKMSCSASKQMDGTTTQPLGGELHGDAPEAEGECPEAGQREPTTDMAAFARASPTPARAAATHGRESE